MTIEITGHAQWQAWQSGTFPPVEKVAEGVWSIPLPLPANPLRYVLVYALECRGGVVLVDAGWDDEPSWQALGSGLATAGYGVQDVRAVLVTHQHPDHLGLAARIREASGAWVALHRLDARPAGAPRTAEEHGLLLHAQLVEHGAPVDEADRILAALDMSWLEREPRPDVLLEDGEIIRLPGRELTTIWTPGHSPGHSCFYDRTREALFSGDHVLPRITPQVAVHATTTDDPLGRFLVSLERLEGLPVDEVLPAHEYRFRGLDRRLRVMARHHTDRLAELSALLSAAPGTTAWDLARTVTWSRPWDSFTPVSRRFALGETLAHLRLLEARREARPVRRPEEPVRWFDVLA
ncbi:MBL fold metallo-hydrolase [Streptomyces sp. SID8379]|uniref:MBL fold metallo-hydrolase n=1 Tax=unclassified Streptomyces TaxID=2593676 RepID=UPI000364D795|nr:MULTISPECIES: MBL fold metallo-hydrolase [unclassified Streptomyces]MYW69864.1 MBL fold metallo-hydrolase [Streptomyces sp. SID8379]